MQLKTTLQTLEEMRFSSPFLTVMNKSEEITDFSVYPKDSVFISAKTGLGLERLKHEILSRFREDFLFCNLFIPYDKASEYAKIKSALIERKIEYTDDGMQIQATVPAQYTSLFEQYIK